MTTSIHVLFTCTCTCMIGGDNTFRLPIPVTDIDTSHHTYFVILAPRGNRRFVPFVDGIEPFTSEITHMPQGWEHYAQYCQHECDTKVKELALLNRAFPENDLKGVSVWWDYNNLPDRDVTLLIDAAGNLAPRPASRPRLRPGEPSH